MKSSVANLTASRVPFVQGFQLMESLLNCTLNVSTQFQLQQRGGGGGGVSYELQTLGMMLQIIVSFAVCS